MAVGMILDPRHADFAETWIAKSDVADRVHVHWGAGRDVLPGFPAASADAAFLDADKTGYDAYYERCLKLLRRGGLVLIDNVLWGGSVANLAAKDADTEAIRALNAKLKADQRIDLTLFAVGDGMTCALKR